MGSVKNEPDSGGEECVTTLDGGSEFSIEVEEAEIKVEEAEIKLEEEDIKIEESVTEENPEAVTFPPLETQPEVSVWELCVMLPRPFTATKR
jgi:copper chaperone CopZ